MANYSIKSIVMLLIAVSMLFLSGCGGNTTTGDIGTPYVGGTEGLGVEFITGTPPAEIFDGNMYPFTVAIKLENQGEYDLASNEGFLKIQGINPEEFGVTASAIKVDIPEIAATKKSSDQTVIKGGTEVVTFPELKYKKDEPGNFMINSFRVSACYDYETKTASKICIKEKNIDGLKDNEICKISENKETVNSGAPIHITNMLESTRGKSGIQISFDVAHVGPATNKWFKKGDLECNDLVSNSELYAVEVIVDPIIDGKYTAKCTGNGASNGGNDIMVKLWGGEPAKVTCSFDVGNQATDFETRVNIKLKYRYLEYIEKQLLVKDLGVQ
jgi:hypothetical protein